MNSRHDSGRSIQLNLWFLLLLIVAGGFISYGFHLRALLPPAVVLAIVFALMLGEPTIKSAAGAWARRRTRRAFAALLQEPSGPRAAALLSRLRNEDFLAISAVASEMPAVIDAAVSPGPLRDGLFELLADRGNAIDERLRPLVRTHLASFGEELFARVFALFDHRDEGPSIAAELLGRAGPAVRRELLRRIARAYDPSPAKDEWRGRWRPIAAPWREDLLAVRERESAGVDALLGE
jgi:hypothetical protein